jgi:hypothetical protein
VSCPWNSSASPARHAHTASRQRSPDLLFLLRDATLFVTLVTEVSLISMEPNLRFERISISRRFLWKSFSTHNSGDSRHRDFIICLNSHTLIVKGALRVSERRCFALRRQARTLLFEYKRREKN